MGVKEQGEPIAIIPDNIACDVNGKTIKEGWTHKKSKHLGAMRRRWTVLFEESGQCALKTYQRYRFKCDKPTECIVTDENVGIASKHESNQFVISNGCTKQMFLFQTESEKERNEWIKVLRS